MFKKLFYSKHKNTSIIEYFDNKDGKYHITILEKISLFDLLLVSLIVI